MHRSVSHLNFIDFLFPLWALTVLQKDNEVIFFYKLINII
jgi:hypothetical protein